MKKVCKIGSIVFFLIIFIIGCGQNRFSSLTEIERNDVEIMESKEVYKGNLNIPIDYDFLLENHEILEYNICISAYSIYDSIALSEFLKDDLKFDEDFNEKFNAIPEPKEYFLFDFNGDDIEDYLVCFHGIAWSGSAGNSIRIYIQEEEGSLKQVFSVTARVYEPNLPNEHAPIAVLDEKTNDYYDLVLPWTENRVWSYDKEKGSYDSYRYADEE